MVCPFSGIRIDNCFYLHIFPNKLDCAIQHFRKCSFNSLIIQKTLPQYPCLAKFLSRNHHGGNAQLRKIRLRIRAEQQHCAQSHFPVSGNAHQFTDFFIRQAREFRFPLSYFFQISFQSLLIQGSERRSGNFPEIVLVFFTECLIAVYLIFCHGLITVPYADKGSFDPALAAIITGAVCQVHPRYFCSYKAFSILFQHSKQRAHHRLHLQALFIDLFL